MQVDWVSQQNKAVPVYQLLEIRDRDHVSLALLSFEMCSCLHDIPKPKRPSPILLLNKRHTEMK